MPIEHNGPRFVIEQLHQRRPQDDAIWRPLPGGDGQPFTFYQADNAAAFLARLNSLAVLGGPQIQYRIAEIDPAPENARRWA
jgi:hypothetical protein